MVHIMVSKGVSKRDWVLSVDPAHMRLLDATLTESGHFASVVPCNRQSVHVTLRNDHQIRTLRQDLAQLGKFGMLGHDVTITME